MSDYITITVSRDDMEAVCRTSGRSMTTAVVEATTRIRAAIPPKERHPTEAAVTAFLRSVRLSPTNNPDRRIAADRILALHAVMPGGVPDEWLCDE